MRPFITHWTNRKYHWECDEHKKSACKRECQENGKKINKITLQATIHDKKKFQLIRVMSQLCNPLNGSVIFQCDQSIFHA